MMTGTTDERRDQGLRLRDFFEVQLLFAERLAERTPLAIADACLTLTNLHRRFGLGRAIDSAPKAEWAHFAAGLERCASNEDRLEWTVAFFIDAAPEPVRDLYFGCFAYDPPNPDGIVRIHFNNRDSAHGVGPLDGRKVDRRIADLRAMFRHIQAHHPEARTVMGASWLYNLEAYRRLFPSQYVASRFTPDRVRLDGTSSWGQLLDFNGAVKPAVRQALLDNVREVDVATPWRAFPLRALGAVSEIEHFYRRYGD
jgi:hypothetical protein